MSLIFQSLQQPAADAQVPLMGGGRSASGTTLSRFGKLRWMIPISIGLILVLVLGSGAVYAVQYLKQRLPVASSPAQGQEVKEQPPPVADRSLKPDVATVAEPVTALPSRPAESMGETASAPKYRFHPPIEGKPMDEKQQPKLRVDQKPPQSPGMKTGPALAPLTAHPESSGAVQATIDEEEPTIVPPIADREREAAAQARRAALEKSARIGRLVHRIEMALAGSTEAGDPSKLLHQLARLKGEHHPYVAKLRAYYNFQRGEMALAENDLHKVVAAHPNDLEAGINLALIEINDQRYDKALARLKTLRKVYPENERIADLIKRLR